MNVYGFLIVLFSHAVFAHPEEPDTAYVNQLNKKASKAFISRPESTHVYQKEAMKIAVELQYTKGIAEAYLNESLVYRLREQNAKQLESLLKALALFEELKDTLNIASALTEIGIAYHQQTDRDEAQRYYQRALHLHRLKKNFRKEAATLRRLGVLEHERGNFEKAKQYYNDALLICRIQNDGEGLANVLNNFGVLYFETGDYLQALPYNKEALALQIKSSNLYRLPAAYYNIGRTYLALNEPETALRYATQGLPWAEQTDNRMAIVEATRLLADIYTHLKDYKKAAYYLNRHIEVKDSIINNQNTLHYARIKSNLESEQKQREIELLQKEQALQKLKEQVIWGSGGILFLAAGVVIYFQRKTLREKQRRLENERKLFEAEHSLIKTELENKQLKAKETEADLEYRNKELITFTLNLAQKNALMENLREGIRDVLNETDKKSKIKLTQLIKLIDYTLETEKDWEEFKFYFEKVHRSFFSRLKADFPELSGADLKLCALISLNLSMKEMAELLGISPESVKMARHRLRKKLNLATEDNLAEFISTYTRY